MQLSADVHRTPLSALPLAPGTSGVAPIVQREPFHHSTNGSGDAPATAYPTATHRVMLGQSTATRSASGVCAGSWVGVTRQAPARRTSAIDRYVAPAIRWEPTVTHT